MKTDRSQALKEAQTDLKSLDAQGGGAEELRSYLPTCVPQGECSDAYRDTYYEVIGAAERAADRAASRAAALDLMASGARDKAARLVAYAEQREAEAKRARAITLADQRFR